jgi:hypothetical protein
MLMQALEDIGLLWQQAATLKFQTAMPAGVEEIDGAL